MTRGQGPPEAGDVATFAGDMLDMLDAPIHQFTRTRPTWDIATVGAHVE